MDRSLLPHLSVTNSEVHYHLHCLGCITLQVVVTAPGHQDVNLFPIGRLISTSDASNEGGVICNLKEFD